MIHDIQCARPNYIGPAARNLRGASSLLQDSRLQKPKAKSESKAEAHAILSYLPLSMLIPPGQIETRLRKMKGVKEVTINHVSHTVKIRYDPSIVTIEKIRTFLKRSVSGPWIAESRKLLRDFEQQVVE
jgi:copper chaperone CopZ